MYFISIIPSWVYGRWMFHKNEGSCWAHTWGVSLEVHFLVWIQIWDVLSTIRISAGQCHKTQDYPTIQLITNLYMAEMGL